MIHKTFKTQGTCATQIDFDDDNGVIRNIQFTGGCNGNLKAVSKLCDGMTGEKIASILKGNLCKNKGTSCADQLAIAVTS